MLFLACFAVTLDYKTRDTHLTTSFSCMIELNAVLSPETKWLARVGVILLPSKAQNVKTTTGDSQDPRTEKPSEPVTKPDSSDRCSFTFFVVLWNMLKYVWY